MGFDPVALFVTTVIVTLGLSLGCITAKYIFDIIKTSIHLNEIDKSTIETINVIQKGRDGKILYDESVSMKVDLNKSEITSVDAIDQETLSFICKLYK